MSAPLSHSQQLIANHGSSTAIAECRRDKVILRE